MRDKRSKAARRRQLSQSLISQAMLQRVRQRIAASGTVKLPAVPGLLDQYVATSSAIFDAVGRGFTVDETATARTLISEKLRRAFLGSPRSKIAFNFESEPARPLGYSVDEDISTITDAYERWIGTSESPLFGSHPDARVLAVALEFRDPPASPILDLGAGTGRNALALARRGYPVDAVEITPKFAEILAAEAAAQTLPICVIAKDVLKERHGLRRDYKLLLASEVVPDFRGNLELRSLFELAAEVLAQGGTLLFNVHLAAPGFTPDKAAREFAQQCYSALFTPSELEQATVGLPFELVSNDSVYQYEQENLPKAAWPPTPWFINWVSGLDVYDVEREKCPVELRWLTYKKTISVSTAAGDRTNEHGLILNRSGPDGTRGKGGRPQRFEPTWLRQALVRRLLRRAVASGTLAVPAIPGMRDQYVELCFAVFTALGRRITPDQFEAGRRLFETVLREAFATSPRSNIVVTYEAPMGSEIRYAVTADARPLAIAYQAWFETLAEPIFGVFPDARMVSLLEQLGDPSTSPVLDIGAGTGRNALYLARLGHPVDAVELTPKFSELLVAEAARQKLPIRVVVGDVFECTEDLGRNYQMLLLSGVVGDFRELQQLRRTFELAADRLAIGGLLLVSMHLTVDGYVPDQACRDWGQQCCSMFFTGGELEQAMDGLPLELVANDSAFDYEREHSPEEAFPPTAAYEEWALGQHMFALDREQCPIELRWLVIRKNGE